MNARQAADIQVDANLTRTRVAADLDANRDKEGLRRLRAAQEAIVSKMKPPPSDAEREAALPKAATAMPAPFEEDGLVAQVAGMAIENRRDHVTVKGHGTYPNGSQGRTDLLLLWATLGRLASALEADKGLPERQEADMAAFSTVANPFD